MKINYFVVVSFFMLSGCSLAPGMTMEGAPETPNVNIMQISANLIYQQELNEEVQPNRLEKQKQREQEKLQYQYRIGPRDVLSIIVWDHPELTIPAGEFRSAEAVGHLVAEDGSIFYPYVGTVMVADKTVAEVRKTLTERIGKTITKPQLDVRVAAFRSQKAYIVGEITKPGPQPITDIPLTIVGAVNQAGGVTENADMINVTLNRNGNVYPIDLLSVYEHGDLSRDFVLRDGDIIHIPDRNQQKVFVLGEVSRPASYLMNKGRMTLAEAISDAGGVDRLSSNPARIFVIRGENNVPEIYHLDSSSPEALILGDKFKLKPRDVVYVDTAGITRWNRVIQQLLPTTQLLQNLSTIDFQSINRANGTNP